MLVHEISNGIKTNIPFISLVNTMGPHKTSPFPVSDRFEELEVYQNTELNESCHENEMLM
jgi:hypothetical protein